MKKLTIIILFTGLVVVAKAQSELTLPFLRDVFQSTYINPTVIPEHTTSIGIPGVSVSGQFIHNGFVPNNFLKFRNDSMSVSVNDFYKELKDRNLIFVGENIDLFHLRFKVNNGFYWFGVRQNLNVSFFYPKNFFALAIEGNEPFLGSELDLSNTKIDVSLYNEYTFGMSKEYPRWVFGGRISLLQGLTNIHFDPTTFNVAVDTFSLTANVNGKIYTSGIPKNGEGEVSMDHTSEIAWISDYLSNFKNKGFALSGGATYKLDDRTRFSASFSNLGFINWKDSLEAYSMTGSSLFDGLGIVTNYLNNTDPDIDSLLTKMKDDFTQDTTHESYRTWLSPRFNISATYNLLRRTTVGLSVSGVYNKSFYPAFTIGLQQGIGRFFNVIATVSANQRTINNLGVGLVIKPGPLQIFIIADNVYPAISPLYFTNANFRVGLNLVFGRVKPADGLPYR
ncbi:MAG: DUF5723 family protein [Tenuifilaceae bacterium]